MERENEKDTETDTEKLIMWDHLVILDLKTVCDFSLIHLN